MSWMIEFLEILGTIAFSVSGAIEAMKKEMDMLGVIVLGLVTAVGGGILRDVVIGEVPPRVFSDPGSAELAIVVAFAAFIIGAVSSKRQSESKHRLWNAVLLVSDAVGLGAFTILGIQNAEELLGNESIALLLFVGVITGVGGGLMRDIFAGNVPYIFKKHVYATASLAGASSYLLLDYAGYPETAAVISLFIVLILRLLAAHFQWNLPKVHLK
ncbi:MAG: trimeric intracellular cation channel family protein [Lachnospiraceae bacterium]